METRSKDENGGEERRGDSSTELTFPVTSEQLQSPSMIMTNDG